MNLHVDLPRLGRCTLSSVVWLGLWVAFVLVTGSPDEQISWLLTLVLSAAVISIGMDYFVWRTPAKEAAREAKRNANRPNIRL